MGITQNQEDVDDVDPWLVFLAAGVQDANMCGYTNVPAGPRSGGG